MKILAIQGSPRRNGNTATLLKKYLEGVKEKHSDVEIKDVFLEGKDIKGCIGCNACQRGKIEFCARNDDMIELYEEIIKADVIVFATPMYFFSVTAQLKGVIDRLYAILTKLMGKRVVLLTTYGAENELEAGVDNVKRMMDFTCVPTGMKFEGHYGVSTLKQSISDNQEAQEGAYNFGKEL